VPKGGPDGGDGGKGGDVWLVADPEVASLAGFRDHPHRRAASGTHGMGKGRHGVTGANLRVLVPEGTVVKDRDGGVVADLVAAGDAVLVARGGRAGRGNARFLSNRRRAPSFAEQGQKGEERWLDLELKLMADVALVGFPNAGKSTLVSRISAARPKVADYPFTTLQPHLGVVRTGESEFVVADVPGLVEGASEGRGLGHQFLRHVERARVLLVLLDLAPSHGTAPVDQERTLLRELGRHRAELLERLRLVVGTKADVATSDWEGELRISAVTGAGLVDLVPRLAEMVTEARGRPPTGRGIRGASSGARGCPRAPGRRRRARGLGARSRAGGGGERPHRPLGARLRARSPAPPRGRPSSGSLRCAGRRHGAHRRPELRVPGRRWRPRGRPPGKDQEAALIVVAKVGSSSITDEQGEIARPAVDKLCSEVAALRDRGHRVVVVTSGAIAAGLPALGLAGSRPVDVATLQAVSAVGQSRLMRVYDDVLARRGLVGGQVLLAPLDFVHRSQYLHARGTLRRLLDLGVVPVVNENDAVADDEVRFGDNDRLAALVANLVAADVLVLLTDAPGVLERDPRFEEGASLIEEIIEVDHELERVAGGAGTVRGSGGMATKLAAAKMAAWSGVRAVIAAADRSSVLEEAVEGVAGVGTVLRPRDRRLPARKLWIAFAVEPSGVVVVDDGARRALVERQSSLLPAGVLDVEGAFEADAAVEICDRGGGVFAKGLARVGSDVLRQVAGRRTADLPEGLPHEVVHRDDLVTLP
jgi:glutamate 5-kinase